MTTSLIDIQTQIEQLKQQEADIKARDFDATVGEILAKMQAFNITVKHLQAAAGVSGRNKIFSVSSSNDSEKAARKQKKAARPPVQAKYRGPNGEEWSGRGLTPRWLSALIADGRTKADFAIAA